MARAHEHRVGRSRNHHLEQTVLFAEYLQREFSRANLGRRVRAVFSLMIPRVETGVQVSIRDQLRLPVRLDKIAISQHRAMEGNRVAFVVGDHQRAMAVFDAGDMEWDVSAFQGDLTESVVDEGAVGRPGSNSTSHCNIEICFDITMDSDPEPYPLSESTIL